MVLAELAALTAASQNSQKSIEVIQDHSDLHSPFSSIRHNEPIDFSGATLGAGLREGFHADRSLFQDYSILTPVSPRSTPVGQDTPPSSDIPWGKVAAVVGGLSFLGAEATLFRKVGLKRGAIVNGSILSGVACLAQSVEVAIIDKEKVPFILSAESAVASIKERGSSFKIGNSDASFTNVSCTSDSGVFNSIILKDDRSDVLSTAALCTAELRVGEKSHLAGLIVSDAGEVYILNGQLSISIDEKAGTGQLGLVTADKEFDPHVGASFGVELVDGEVKSLSWVRIGSTTSYVEAKDQGPIDQETPIATPQETPSSEPGSPTKPVATAQNAEGIDNFYLAISGSEILNLGLLINAALNAPKATLTPELVGSNLTPTLKATATPSATEAKTKTPTATKTATATETNTPVPMPELERSVIALLGEMGVDYTKTIENGSVTLVNNETGKEIMKNGKMALEFDVELAKKDCEPTDIVPSKIGGLVLGTSGEKSYAYQMDLLSYGYDNNLWKPKDKSGYFNVSDILIDRENQCWGFLVDDDYLFYRDKSGLVHIDPIIPPTKDELHTFKINR